MSDKVRNYMKFACLFCAVALADEAVEAESPGATIPVFSPPQAPSSATFYDDFQSGLEKWTLIDSEMYGGEFKLEEAFENSGDNALTVTQEAQKYGAFARFAKPLDTTGDVVVQYDLKLKEGLQCGGAYIKLLRGDFDELKSDTDYTVMFGPDRCGGTNKVHFIFQYQNPVTEKWQEHHLKDTPSIKTDSESHLYALAVRKDNSFSIYIDGKEERRGSIMEDFEPPLEPPAEIDDPEDEKPGDWVENAKVADPDATKPDDWDEDAPYQIEDPIATKPEDWLEDEELLVADPLADMPEDWDTEDDGEWEAPLVDNPKCKDGKCGEWKVPMKHNPDYKGKWYAPMIDNPDYKGIWKPKRIANPDHYTVENFQLEPMSAVAIEIWTMQKGIQFDNFYIGHDSEEAYKYGEETWTYKTKVEALQNPVPGTVEKALSFFAPIGNDFLNFNFMGKESQFTLPALVTIIIGLVSLFLLLACCNAEDVQDVDTVKIKQEIVENDSANDDGTSGSSPTTSTKEKPATPSSAKASPQSKNGKKKNKKKTKKAS